MKKKTSSKKAKKKAEEIKQYVMYGFEEADPEHVAYLRISSTNTGQEGETIAGPYSAVSDAESATVFPAKCSSKKKKGFGTPYQWAEFFAEEEELKDWNFHPVPYAQQ